MKSFFLITLLYMNNCIANNNSYTTNNYYQNNDEWNGFNSYNMGVLQGSGLIPQIINLSQNNNESPIIKNQQNYNNLQEQTENDYNSINQ